MKKSNRSGKFMMGLGLLLTIAAICLAAYNLWGEYRATKNANEALLQVAQVIAEKETAAENGEAASDAESLAAESDQAQGTDSGSNGGMTVRMIDGVDYIGIIEIPSLSLKLPIISEWDDAKLKIAPCRYVGSAYNGDLIISGHSYKNHFRYIRNLAVGESVIFTDFEGTRFVYEVTAYEVVGGSDVEGMLSGEWDLSLFTCTYNGSARHTVRCRLIPEENPWMEERKVPESTYKASEGGWTGMETENSEAAETVECWESEAENSAGETVGEDDENAAIYQDAELINDLK